MPHLELPLRPPLTHLHACGMRDLDDKTLGAEEHCGLTELCAERGEVVAADGVDERADRRSDPSDGYWRARRLREKPNELRRRLAHDLTRAIPLLESLANEP